MSDTQTLASAMNEVTEESITATETAEETAGTETVADDSTDDTSTDDGDGDDDSEGTADPALDVSDVDEEVDVFDSITPTQLAAIKASPELNALRKSLVKGYEAKTTELKQLVALGDAWKQNPAAVVQALATQIGMSIPQARAVAAAAGQASDAAKAELDPIESAGKDLEALFGQELGPRVRGVFEKWADARMGRALDPVKNAVGQVTNANEQARMMTEETNFKSRHKDLTPAIENRIVALGQSGKYIPGKAQTPSEFLEALHDIATAQLARETARNASGNAAKQLVRKIEGNRKDREPSGVSGRGGTVKPVSKISSARSISEALDMAEAELQAEGQ
jgi:hypothetical protein